MKLIIIGIVLITIGFVILFIPEINKKVQEYKENRAFTESLSDYYPGSANWLKDRIEFREMFEDKGLIPPEVIQSGSGSVITIK